IGLVIVALAELVDSTRIGPTTLAIGLFAFGMGVAGVATEPGLIPAARRAAPWWIVATAVSGVLALALAIAGPYRFLGHQPLVSIGIAIVVAATVLHVMDNPVSYAARIANFYPVRAVGVMSLSLCLMSGLVVQVLWKIFCEGSGLSSGAVAVILTLGSPFAFAIAIETAHWFERPCLAGPDRDAFFVQIKLLDAAAPAVQHAQSELAPPSTAAPTLPAPSLPAPSVGAPLVVAPLAAAPLLAAPSVGAPSVAAPFAGARALADEPAAAPISRLRPLVPLADPDPVPLVARVDVSQPFQPLVAPVGRAELPPPPVTVRSNHDGAVIDLRDPPQPVAPVKGLPAPTIDLRDDDGAEGLAEGDSRVFDQPRSRAAMGASAVVASARRSLMAPPLPPPDPRSLVA
ncbi:MAG: hypothetical protein AB7N61_24125, partial [Acidimicrobiia bacterium]